MILRLEPTVLDSVESRKQREPVSDAKSPFLIIIIVWTRGKGNYFRLQ